MAVIYSMSDIHGDINAMTETLRLIDLDAPADNMLIFLGDYIDRGNSSVQVLSLVKQLEAEYPGQVVVLLGNHEQMFMDWLTGVDEFQWISHEENLVTVKSFIGKETFQKVVLEIQENSMSYAEMNDLMREEVKTQQDIIHWLFKKKEQPLYYETSGQIYVHAGICETDETLWKQATTESEFTWEYPPETGAFYKDIIAGHTSSVEVSEDVSYLGKVFWDRENHFFIDGDTLNSHTVPLLKFDSESGVYTAYKKDTENVFKEYRIVKRKV